MSVQPGVTVTAFPVPGYNFRSPATGAVLGVTAVQTDQAGAITVSYINGGTEVFAAEKVQEVSTK